MILPICIFHKVRHGTKTNVSVYNKWRFSNLSHICHLMTLEQLFRKRINFEKKYDADISSWMRIKYKLRQKGYAFEDRTVYMARYCCHKTVYAQLSNSFVSIQCS